MLIFYSYVSLPEGKVVTRYNYGSNPEKYGYGATILQEEDLMAPLESAVLLIKT